MYEVYCGCSNISDLTALANWDANSVTNMYLMFYKCTQLTDTSAINDWDISSVTNFGDMFGGCPSHPEFTKRSGTWDKYGTFKPTN